jgi:hypothetical protein
MQTSGPPSLDRFVLPAEKFSTMVQSSALCAYNLIIAQLDQYAVSE